MPAREQIGILLIAAIAGFIVTSVAIQSGPEGGVERLGYDLPSAIYSERPTESSNKFRISLVPKENLEQISLEVYWLRSRSIPNSTVVDPDPISDYIRTLLSMVEYVDGGDALIEIEVRYNGSAARMQMYDFNPLLRIIGVDLADSPTCFAYITSREGEVLRYFEGVTDFFPFPDKTISSLRLTASGTTEVYSPTPEGTEEKLLNQAPDPGTWIAEQPQRDEITELAVLLSEDARLYINSKWGTKPEKMQVTILKINGDEDEALVEFA